MRKFQGGDEVKIVDAPENGKHLIGKTGIVKPPQAHVYDDDDVIVWIDGGERGYFKERQLERVD